MDSRFHLKFAANLSNEWGPPLWEPKDTRGRSARTRQPRAEAPRSGSCRPPCADCLPSTSNHPPAPMPKTWSFDPSVARQDSEPFPTRPPALRRPVPQGHPGLHSCSYVSTGPPARVAPTTRGTPLAPVPHRAARTSHPAQTSPPLKRPSPVAAPPWVTKAVEALFLLTAIIGERTVTVAWPPRTTTPEVSGQPARRHS